MSYCSTSRLSTAGVKEPACELQVKLILFSRTMKINSTSSIDIYLISILTHVV